MKYTLLFLTTIISVTYTLPLENDGDVIKDANVRNNLLEQFVLDALEDLREIMLHGSDDIPVLDPFELEHLHLDLRDFGFVDSHLTVGNVEARQFSTFVVDDLSVSITSLLLQRYAVEIEGHIPVFEIDFETYDLDVIVFGMNAFGNGNAKLRFWEPRIKASVEISVSIFGGTTINIRDANVVFQLAAFETEVIGMFDNDEVTAGFLDDFLAMLIPEMVTRFQEDISKIINSILIGISIDLDLITRNILKSSTLETFEQFKSTIPTDAGLQG